MFVRPEAARSIPGQAEVGITSYGGPNWSVTTSSVDLGIGAKNQSCAAIAGSHRNIPQDSLWVDSPGVKTLIVMLGTERSHITVKLRILAIHVP